MRALLPTLLLMCGLCSTTTAQWRLGVEFSAVRYRGSSYDTSSSHVASEGRPGGGPTIGLSITRQWHRVGAAVRVSYANPGFAVSGHGVNLTDKTTGRLIEATSLISTRVGGIGPSGAVWVGLGPALHLWDFDGEVHTRTGAIGRAAYEWAVARRWTGAVSIEGTMSKSWFDAADVPPEFERRVTWRYGVGLGLSYQL